MYIGFKHLHSTIAFVLLIVFALAVVFHIIGFLTSSEYTKGHRVSALVGLIATHLQLLAGLVLYFISPLGVSNLSGDTMKDSLGRLYALEHPLINLIAIVLITVGYSKAKKAITSRQKFSNIAIFYGLGLILILSRIPWQTWTLVN